MPHIAVICESAESTKLLVVYDTSVKCESGLSLIDCLKKAPLLQNKAWDILIRTRFWLVVIYEDIEKAFLEIRIRENERDCLRLHWSEKTNYDIIKVYRFTRLVFELNQLPFILEGQGWYVCGRLRNWGKSTSEVDKVKSYSVKLFQRGGIKLHKSHSNKQVLETNNSVNENY